MAYPGIAFVFMVSVAIGSAIYYYMHGDWRQEQNVHHDGYRRGNYDYPPKNVSRPTSSNSDKKKRKGRKYEDCSICFEPMETSSIKTLSCDHMFHEACITKWLRSTVASTCPLCRRAPHLA